jgi:hypothetical protein
MDAQTVWNVWRRILREDGFYGRLFSDSDDKLSKDFFLNEKELEIAKIYASTPQQTQYFITNYRFRLSNSFINALDTGSPLTLQSLLAKNVSITDLSRQFFDEVKWRDYGPNVLTLCSDILRFLKSNIITSKPEGFRSLIDLESSSIDLLRKLASQSPAIQFNHVVKPDQAVSNKNSMTVKVAHILTPWLKDKLLLGTAELERFPQYFLIYLPVKDEHYKLAAISERGTQILGILDEPMNKKDINTKLKSLNLLPFEIEDNLIIRRLLAYNVVSIGSDFLSSIDT